MGASKRRVMVIGSKPKTAEDHIRLQANLAMKCPQCGAEPEPWYVDAAGMKHLRFRHEGWCECTLDEH